MTWVFGTRTQTAGAGRRGAQRPGLQAAGSGGPWLCRFPAPWLESSVAPRDLSQKQREDRCSEDAAPRGAGETLRESPRRSLASRRASVEGPREGPADGKEGARERRLRHLPVRLSQGKESEHAKPPDLTVQEGLRGLREAALRLRQAMSG